MRITHAHYAPRMRTGLGTRNAMSSRRLFGTNRQNLRPFQRKKESLINFTFVVAFLRHSILMQNIWAGFCESCLKKRSIFLALTIMPMEALLKKLSAGERSNDWAFLRYASDWYSHLGIGTEGTTRPKFFKSNPCLQYWPTLALWRCMERNELKIALEQTSCAHDWMKYQWSSSKII